MTVPKQVHKNQLQASKSGPSLCSAQDLRKQSCFCCFPLQNRGTADSNHRRISKERRNKHAPNVCTKHTCKVRVLSHKGNCHVVVRSEFFQIPHEFLGVGRHGSTRPTQERTSCKPLRTPPKACILSDILHHVDRGLGCLRMLTR